MEFYKKWIHSLKNVQKSILIRLVCNAVRNKMDTCESFKWLMNFDWSWCKCESTRINTVFHENARFRQNGPTKTGCSIFAGGKSLAQDDNEGPFEPIWTANGKDLPVLILDFGSIFKRMESRLWTVHFHLQESWTFQFDQRPPTSDSTCQNSIFQSF